MASEWSSYRSLPAARGLYHKYVGHCQSFPFPYALRVAFLWHLEPSSSSSSARGPASQPAASPPPLPLPAPLMLQLVSYPLHLHLLSCSTGGYAWDPLLSLESPTSSDKPSHPVAGVGLSTGCGYRLPSENPPKPKWIFLSASLAYRPVNPSENLASPHTRHVRRNLKLVFAAAFWKGRKWPQGVHLQSQH